MSLLIAKAYNRLVNLFRYLHYYQCLNNKITNYFLYKAEMSVKYRKIFNVNCILNYVIVQNLYMNVTSGICFQ